MTAAAAPAREVPQPGFLSAAAREAAGPAGRFSVKVTNTGRLDADDVVLGFVAPPGAGRGGVAMKELFGFERVHVPAGQSVVVDLYPDLSILTAVAADGSRAARAGTYTVSFGVPEGRSHGAGYAEHTFRAE